MNNEFLPHDSLSYIQRCKPVDFLRPVISHLRDGGVVKVLNPSRRLSLESAGVKHVAVILDGDFEIRRKDGLILIKGSAPFVLGFSEGLFPRMAIYFQAKSRLEVIMVPFDDAVNVIEKHNLWKNMTALLAWQLQVMAARDQEITSVDAHTMICAKIMDLFYLEKNNGVSLNIVDYIQQRTKLSKSIIHRILAELKGNGSISVQRGKLIMVDLPLLQKGFAATDHDKP
jgi:hypothetical protein